MLQRRLSTAISTILLFTSTNLAADQILLDDGSILKGSIKQISEGKVVMDTAFANEVTVDFNRVTQISTDQKHLIELDSSDRVLGQLTVNDQGQHQLTGTAFGTVDIDPKRINTLWEKDAVQPQNAQLEQQYQQEIEQIKTAQAQEKPNWKKLTQLKCNSSELNAKHYWIHGAVIWHLVCREQVVILTEWPSLVGVSFSVKL